MRNDRGRHPASDKVAADPASPLTEFLNPNSMITPGAAGAFTMMITNTLCQQFSELHLGGTGLVVSFLFGALVFAYTASIPVRVVYYMINSLIIFTVAMGSNAIGQQAGEHLVQKPGNVVLGSRAQEDFSLAEANKQTDNKSQQNKQSGQQTPPPEKPKFFRQWF
jgi:hypothetical protein